MIKGIGAKKIVVVMPAYNAARTLRQTYDEVMAQGVVDLVILVDDASGDDTVAIAISFKTSRQCTPGLRFLLDQQPLDLVERLGDGEHFF